MAGAFMNRSEPDYSDVQGLVRYGYGKMTEASFVLLHVKDLRAARSWLLAAPITNAVELDTPPPTALQIAFTAAGLDALNVPKSVIAGFSPEFLTGMTEESRSRRLGDVGANAPSQWAWGNGRSIPHLMVMFFAEAGGLDAFVRNLTGPAWNEAFEELRWLGTANFDGVEPFGFTDGISQPEIDWEQSRDQTRPQVEYSNVACLGEFLLGYRNEYDKYTNRPLVDADAGSTSLLPAEDAPEKRDVGRNGSYLVMRQLRQDVRSFWQFAHRQANGDPALADRLAAAFVGRTRAGEPLVALRQQKIPGIGEKQADKNQFTFDDDPTGIRCPFGAHVRRANPRSADYEGRPNGLARLVAAIGFGPKGFRDDLISSARFHRILRRGREYGPGLSPPDAMYPAPPNELERGLHFVCLNANISRQFEFLQNAWIMNTKFSGMTGESDPLLGNREAVPGCPVGDFIAPEENGVRRRLSGLPQFVTVRGGAYFFLPSLRALRYFAGSIAIVATLGTLAEPVIGQVTQPGRRVITADSARLATLAQVRTIPNVIGMATSKAIDSLAWTKLQIVQRNIATTKFAAGTVFDQRPRAGTPSTYVRAETLFIAASRKPSAGGTSLADVLGAIVKAAASTDSTRVQDRTRVPDLHGNSPTMVTGALRKSRLSLGKVSRDYSDDVPSGRVFRQEPPATREVATNTSVDVSYSIGPHPTINTLFVPRVVGLTLAEAADSLKRVRLQTGHIDYLARRGAEGRVVQQVPQDGQPAHPNDAVDLTITTTPSHVSVPSVIGLTRLAARQKLETAGLSVGRVTLVVRRDAGTGIVSQIPLPRTTVDSGTLVDLVENRLPEVRRVTVPNLSGKSIAAAGNILKRDSLVLGDVLRPAVRAVDQVIDQRPKPGETVLMHSAVTVALGTDSPIPPGRTARVPAVINLTVDSARRVLADSGFTQLSIGGGGETLTSASIVDSQIPAAGTFAAPSALVYLVASQPMPVPKLVGMRSEDARIVAEINDLRMIVIDTIRRLRRHEEVARQDPVAGSPRPADSRVDVAVAIPFMPPLAAAILGFVIVAGGSGVAVKKWWPHDNGTPPPAPPVSLEPVIGQTEPPVLYDDGQETLVKKDFTLRFGQDSEPLELELPGDSIVKPEKSDA